MSSSSPTNPGRPRWLTRHTIEDGLGPISIVAGEPESLSEFEHVFQLRDAPEIRRYWITLPINAATTSIQMEAWSETPPPAARGVDTWTGTVDHSLPLALADEGNGTLAFGPNLPLWREGPQNVRVQRSVADDASEFWTVQFWALR